MTNQNTAIVKHLDGDTFCVYAHLLPKVTWKSLRNWNTAAISIPYHHPSRPWVVRPISSFSCCGDFPFCVCVCWGLPRLDSEINSSREEYRSCRSNAQPFDDIKIQHQGEQKKEELKKIKEIHNEEEHGAFQWNKDEEEEEEEAASYLNTTRCGSDETAPHTHNTQQKRPWHFNIVFPIQAITL